MHVKTKQIAFLGLLTAIVTIFIVMGSVIESNTLFLLAASAFAVGIAVREYGLRMAVGFWLACLFLGVIISPNKLYMITYGAMSFYILFEEVSYQFVFKRWKEKGKWIHFFSKWIMFNLCYFPMLLLFPKIFYGGKISSLLLVVIALAGQFGWFIYDRAYQYFQGVIWTKFRKRLGFFNEMN